jgi:hypothetical protein
MKKFGRVPERKEAGPRRYPSSAGSYEGRVVGAGIPDRLPCVLTVPLATGNKNTFMCTIFFTPEKIPAGNH